MNMNSHPKLLKPGHVARSDFEFPTPASGADSSNVVFCGKVITRRTEPGPAPPKGKETETRFSRVNGSVAALRSPSGKESRCRRSGSLRKYYNGMFGTVKFPLQMDLSDIKTRQEQRETVPLSKLPAEDCGGDSCWELVGSLRRRGTLLSTFLAKATFGCIPNM